MPQTQRLGHWKSSQRDNHLLLQITEDSVQCTGSQTVDKVIIIINTRCCDYSHPQILINGLSRHKSSRPHRNDSISFLNQFRALRFIPRFHWQLSEGGFLVCKRVLIKGIDIGESWIQALDLHTNAMNIWFGVFIPTSVHFLGFVHMKWFQRKYSLDGQKCNSVRIKNDLWYSPNQKNCILVRIFDADLAGIYP